MHNRKLVLSQLLDFLDRNDFNYLVRLVDHEHKLRNPHGEKQWRRNFYGWLQGLWNCHGKYGRTDSYYYYSPVFITFALAIAEQGIRWKTGTIPVAVSFNWKAHSRHCRNPMGRRAGETSQKTSRDWLL